jgi:hypothetical protein
MRAFLAEQGHIVVKPLHGMGGRSIFVLRQGDNNANVVFETLTDYGQQYAMAQTYIPEITRGDKRIIIVDGQPVSRVLARVPAAGDNRGNLVAGAQPEVRELTARDRWICDRGGRSSGRRACFCRPRRDRRLPHRDQRHQPDGHEGAAEAGRPGCGRHAVRCPGRPACGPDKADLNTSRQAGVAAAVVFGLAACSDPAVTGRTFEAFGTSVHVEIVQPDERAAVAAVTELESRFRVAERDWYAFGRGTGPGQRVAGRGQPAPVSADLGRR